MQRQQQQWQLRWRIVVWCVYIGALISIHIFFFVWFELVWFVLLRWFVFSSVFRNKYSMAYSAIQTIHHAVKLIFVAQNTLAHTRTKSAMSWKYWNLFTKREKSIKEEEQEEQAKVEYFRFREKHTRTHIAHNTYSSLLLWTDKAPFHHVLYKDPNAATARNDTFLCGVAICRSLLKLDADPNEKKKRHNVFSCCFFFICCFHVENYYTWRCQLIHVASKASIIIMI